MIRSIIFFLHLYHFFILSLSLFIINQFKLDDIRAPFLKKHYYYLVEYFLYKQAIKNKNQASFFL